MKRVEFTHDDEHYRIELDDQLLTMATWADGHWHEVARLTMSAAGVLADLDGLVDPDRPRGVAARAWCRTGGDGDGATDRRDW